MASQRRATPKLVDKPLKSRKLEVSYVPISALRCNPCNARIHTEKQVQQIAHSISALGFNVPILVDQTCNILAGHGRYLASKLLGLTVVPAIVVDHLSAAQAKAFMIADNKLTENAAWNNRLLAEQLKILAEVELDFDLTQVTGFEVGEIDCLIEGLSPFSIGKEDPADAIPETSLAVPITCLGDLWLLGQHRIYCGSSLNVQSYSALMDGSRAAMVFTDPPFNVPISGHATGLGAIQHSNFTMASGEMSEGQFTDFLTRACNLMASHTSEGSIHFVCMDWRHVGELQVAGKAVYSELKNICVWIKDNGGMGSLYRSQHELVFVYKHGKAAHTNNVQLGRFGRYRTNVWSYPGANSFSRTTAEGNLLELHPTVKPVAMIADAIMDCSARGSIVLDAFLGSGTSVIAAERTGRVCYGIEIDPKYVDTIVRRWQAFTGLGAIHADSGQTFVELEKEASSVI
jgi:DNA modification methylase